MKPIRQCRHRFRINQNIIYLIRAAQIRYKHSENAENGSISILIKGDEAGFVLYRKSRTI